MLYLNLPTDLKITAQRKPSANSRSRQGRWAQLNRTRFCRRKAFTGPHCRPGRGICPFRVSVQYRAAGITCFQTSCAGCSLPLSQCKVLRSLRCLLARPSAAAPRLAPPALLITAWMQPAFCSSTSFACPSTCCCWDPVRQTKLGEAEGIAVSEMLPSITAVLVAGKD